MAVISTVLFVVLYFFYCMTITVHDKIIVSPFLRTKQQKSILKYAIKITDKIMLGTFVKAAIVYSLPRGCAVAMAYLWWAEFTRQYKRE